MKKYQPSNGTEGMNFTDSFCMQCRHCDPDPDGPKQCEILCRSLVYQVDDPEYPEEWTYDENGQPTCTKHALWNWETQGDPDSRENTIIDDPNQIKIEF